MTTLRDLALALKARATVLTSRHDFRLAQATCTWRPKSKHRLLIKSRPGLAQEGPKWPRRGALGPLHFFSFRVPPFDVISFIFLRLVGLLLPMALVWPSISFNTLISLRRWFPIIPFLPHNPWPLPQVSLSGPILGLAGGISRWAKLGPTNSLIITR